MKTIIFTLDQVNELLNALGDLPYKQAKPLIDFIYQISNPQLQPPAQEATKPDPK